MFSADVNTVIGNANTQEQKAQDHQCHLQTHHHEETGVPQLAAADVSEMTDSIECFLQAIPVQHLIVSDHQCYLACSQT